MLYYRESAQLGAVLCCGAADDSGRGDPRSAQVGEQVVDRTACALHPSAHAHATLFCIVQGGDPSRGQWPCRKRHWCSRGRGCCCCCSRAGGCPRCCMVLAVPGFCMHAFCSTNPEPTHTEHAPPTMQMASSRMVRQRRQRHPQRVPLRHQQRHLQQRLRQHQQSQQQKRSQLPLRRVQRQQSSQPLMARRQPPQRVQKGPTVRQQGRQRVRRHPPRPRPCACRGSQSGCPRPSPRCTW